MSSFPSRKLEIWQSSRASEFQTIQGVFAFHVAHTLMVPQTLQFMMEKAQSGDATLGICQKFIRGMYYAQLHKPCPLLLWMEFNDSNALFSYPFECLIDAVGQLEIHTDINFTYDRVTYFADAGLGPTVPLLIISRIPFFRGVGFEVEERGQVSQSMTVGDFTISSKCRVAHRHYSSGLALLAGEDAISGLIDAAFMQFYLAIEALLEAHEKEKAVESGTRLYGSLFTSALASIVEHVYLARHRFYGHAHPKFLKGILDSEAAYSIAKQALVAKWCARQLFSLELKRPLVVRETRLHTGLSSIEFSGDVSSLATDFKLP
jgi:hypothetical protein